MRIIGYCWASRSGENALSDPDESTRTIREYLDRKKWDGPIQLEDPSEAFVDFHLRERGKTVVDSLRGGDILIVPDQSYLFSSPSQGLAFMRMMREKGICVHCINLSGDILEEKLFDLLIAILAPLAEVEPQLIKDRARQTKRRERQRGKYLGGTPPLGFSVNRDGKLHNSGTRTQILRKVLQLKAKGMSLRKIAAEMQKKGFKISHTTINSLLKSVGYSSATAERGSPKRKPTEQVAKSRR